MTFHKILATAAIALSATAAGAQDNSALVIGKSIYNARCALCHGADGKGGGEIATLFKVPPADLTQLAEREGRFPFARVYDVLAQGMTQPGHGDSEMPVWGEYFVADALEDRGISAEDAKVIAAGRILAVTYYLESIQVE